MKYCTGCKQTKETTEYYKRSDTRDGLQTQCKVCFKARNKKHYQNNREKYKVNAKKWQQSNREKERIRKKKYRENNREKYNASVRKWRENNPEKYKKRVNARKRERYSTDPQFRLARNLRRRLHHALKGKNKSASTIRLLGCTVAYLMEHLESQFQPGMTWENQGEWHVDHMIPCNSFDLEDPEQQRRCFHYTNLQPMWASENISKGDTILYNRVWDGNQWINN